MVFTILFYVLVVIFILTLIVCWFSNLFGLPGNWLIVFLNAVWYFGTDPETQWHVSLGMVILFTVLTGIGELIEFGASVLGTKKVGGSRRAATCSIIGSVVGGIIGGVVGLPIAIPLVGIVVGSILFACGGAMVGATLGEKWQGSKMNKSLTVGGAAAAGRFVGTVSKVAVGFVILVISISALFVKAL